VSANRCVGRRSLVDSQSSGLLKTLRRPCLLNIVPLSHSVTNAGKNDIYEAEVQTVNDRLLATNHRPAGFDYLRIFLSLSIVAFHSVVTSYGFEAEHWFWGGPIRPLIFVLVPSFFALSGFLVAGSLERNDLPCFLTLRVLRIFPALVVEVALSGLIIGPLLTTWSLHDYFNNRKFFSYFGNLFGWIHYYLPGVFLTNPAPGLVNLQLWTVPYELECYVAISIVAWIGLYARSRLLLSAIVVVSLTVAAYQCLSGNMTPLYYRPPGRMIVLCFLAGVALYGMRKQIPLNGSVFAAAVALAWLFMSYRGTTYLAALPVAYVTVFVGLQNPRRLSLLRSADYSYGLYLYGFPVQQTVSYLFPNQRMWWFNLTMALAIAGSFALMSWHIIESRVLSQRKAVLQFVTATTMRFRRRGEAADVDDVTQASSSGQTG
jgi:peptidoglycan/LPS O-acetylase OafA/YrhL